MSTYADVRWAQPAYQRAIDDLEERVQSSFPSATFAVSEGEDPVGVYLYATVDVDDLTTVLATVADRLFEYQVEQELPIYLISQRPLPRALQTIGMQPHILRRPLTVDEVYRRR
jgi:hypothetical protein